MAEERTPITRSDLPDGAPLGPGACVVTPRARLAGWHGAGMLDWPGRVATTVFLTGCNFRCPYCHNPQLLAGHGACEQSHLDGLLRHLRTRRNWLDGIVVTGGEPTQDPGLFGLLEEFALLGLPVKLDTNGSEPDMLAALLDARLVSAVSLDVKTVPERYAALTGVPDAWDRVSECIATLLWSGTPHEFRTTVYPGAVLLDDLPRIAELLSGGDGYVLQQFRPDRTLDARAADVLPYMPEALLTAAARCTLHIPTSVRGV